MFERLADTARNTPSIKWRSRYLQMKIGVRSGDDATVIEFDRGIVRVKTSDGGEEPTFTLIANKDAWELFAEPAPPPGFNDIMAMSSCGNLEIQGDFVAFQQNLLLVSMLFEGLRTQGAAA
jgi:hypothetical protein